jgi:hypothetical protein
MERIQIRFCVGSSDGSSDEEGTAAEIKIDRNDTSSDDSSTAEPPSSGYERTE